MRKNIITETQRQQLERVPYSKVDALTVAEALNVIETTLTCVVRNMQPHAPVYSNNEQTHVVAQTNARSYSHLSEKVPELELRIGPAGVFVYRPHVAGVEEQCAEQTAEKTRTIL